jgi:hypothetical protein
MRELRLSPHSRGRSSTHVEIGVRHQFPKRLSKLVSDTNFLLLLTSSVSLALAATPIQDGNLVLFLQREAAPIGAVTEFGETPVQLLNDADDGRQVAVAEVPADWSHLLPTQRPHTLELIVLVGGLMWDDSALGTHDHAYLPAGAPAPRLVAGPQGATVLLFLDPPRSTDPDAARVRATDSIAWRPALVAQRDTGQALDLEVKDLLWVESTGQRTWLVRAGAELKIPWEVHEGVEEGYLLTGDYRLGECLPGKTTPVTGAYAPGGYFYRPGGIVHSGPDSGSRSGAVWLLRTPTRLTVDFVDGCVQ